MSSSRGRSPSIIDATLGVSDETRGAPEGASPPGPSRGPSGKRLVLCVDDEPHNLDLLDRSLRRRYDVLTEAMPEAALAAVAANDDLAVVLADYRMPSMDGVSMLARIAAVRPDVRRVLVTGYADADPVLAAVASGEVHSVVHKPW
ncbi:MAG: response regulator, partial [Kofleriaceae bacterium]